MEEVEQTSVTVTVTSHSTGPCSWWADHKYKLVMMIQVPLNWGPKVPVQFWFKELAIKKRKFNNEIERGKYPIIVSDSDSGIKKKILFPNWLEGMKASRPRGKMKVWTSKWEVQMVSEPAPVNECKLSVTYPTYIGNSVGSALLALIHNPHNCF